MFTRRKLKRAAERAVNVAANYPDPASAVLRARAEMLYAGLDPDQVRVSVSRPGVPGRLARVILVYRNTEVTATKEVTR